MVIAGSPQSMGLALFPEGFVPQVLEFVVSCWSGLRRPLPSEHEEHITGRFYLLMKTEYPLRDLPWFITLETPELNPQTGEMIGRTDLRFLHRKSLGQDLFLVIETKRLNLIAPSGRRSSNAAAYVGIDGMQRFVDGKYSSGLPCGVMLGYVMDGRIAKAKKAIIAGLKRFVLELSLVHSPDLQACPHLPLPHGSTEHNRQVFLGGPLRLHHIFLPA